MPTRDRPMDYTFSEIDLGHVLNDQEKLLRANCQYLILHILFKVSSTKFPPSLISRLTVKSNSFFIYSAWFQSRLRITSVLDSSMESQI
ncbi:hypothetical protein HanIR_Chr05g0230001 [Helianthus annuus]|nr:hypothetical protein HanIR_Chr05g0230001 [Helianthus annuus]